MLKVLFEDEHILVCNKPAGIATQSGKITEKDMVSEVNNYLKSSNKKASAFLINRLDKPVCGILVFAKTKDSAAELNRQLTSGRFNKKYYAMLSKAPEKATGTLTDYIYKEGNKAFICDKSEKDLKGAKQAELEYEVISLDEQSRKKYFPFIQNIDDTYACVDVHLITGRFHQIRCQFSNIGCPILGDKLYGSTLSFREGIGLANYTLHFYHPVKGEQLSFTL